MVSKEAFPTPGMACGRPVLWECELMDSTINNASQINGFLQPFEVLLEGACPGRAGGPVSFILILLLHGASLKPTLLGWDLHYPLQGIPTVPGLTVQCPRREFGICFLVVVI